MFVRQTCVRFTLWCELLPTDQVGPTAVAHYRRAHYHRPLSHDHKTGPQARTTPEPVRPASWQRTRDAERPTPTRDAGRTEPISRGLFDEQQQHHHDKQNRRRYHLRPRGRMNADSMTTAPNRPHQPKPRTVSTSSGSTDGATITGRT